MPEHADAIWTGILGLSFATGLAAEVWALRRRIDQKPSGTLTAYLRRWLGIDPRRWWAPFGIALFVGALATVASHIVLGIP